MGVLYLTLCFREIQVLVLNPAEMEEIHFESLSQSFTYLKVWHMSQIPRFHTSLIWQSKGEA